MLCNHQNCVTKVPLFNHLSLDDQLKINKLVQHKTFQKGEIVFAPHQEARLFVISEGSMKVYQLSMNGKEQLLRLLEAGEYEGENQLFGAENETVFGEALEQTEVCFIKQENFSKLLLEHPELSLKLLFLNAQKSEELKKQNHFLVMEKVDERLANYLLNLSKVKDSLIFEIPMKQKELATFLGTSAETLSRKLKSFEESKIIRRSRRMIEILDYDALVSLS